MRKERKVELLGDLRIRVRRWLGLSQFQKRTNDRLKALEGIVAISQEDIARLNAATTRIAARVGSLLDQIDTLGTGNDDEVRAQAKQEALLQASADLRPVLEQLEALGADATNVVPPPAPEQVPVEPGPDVAPVENVGTDPGTGTVGTPEPAPGAPVGDTVTTPDAPVFDESGIAVEGADSETVGEGSVVTAPEAEPLPAAGPTDGLTVPGEDASSSQPGGTGDEATPTSNS